MRIVGVIDLRAGRAVHARGGVRDRYEPIDVAAGERMDGDPRALARLFVERFGLEDIYLADLDAIRLGAPPHPTIQEIAPLARHLWLDSGVSSIADARRALEAGASHVVVGLETLQSFEALSAVSRTIGRERTVFSLDLRGGVPLAAAGLAPESVSLASLARRAADAGAGSAIVLDVARVGMRGGVDVSAIADVRRGAPSIPIFAGGGVRGWDDLNRLASAGCDGALVATALFDGSLLLRAPGGRTGAAI